MWCEVGIPQMGWIYDKVFGLKISQITFTLLWQHELGSIFNNNSHKNTIDNSTTTLSNWAIILRWLRGQVLPLEAWHVPSFKAELTLCVVHISFTCLVNLVPQRNRKTGWVNETTAHTGNWRQLLWVRPSHYTGILESDCEESSSEKNPNQSPVQGISGSTWNICSTETHKNTLI